MLKQALLHLPYDPMAYPVAEDEVEIVLRAARGDLKSVQLVYIDRYALRLQPKETTLYRVGSDALFDYWTGRMRLKYGRFMYHFALNDGQSTTYYGEGGLSAEAVTPETRNPWAWCFHYPYTWRHGGVDDPPAWATDAIVYQVLVDRFANGDLSNDPPSAEPWGAHPTSQSFFGGDLAGITDRLDYVARLGASCIYLTPILLAPSNHKYDTTDYYQLDPHFGDEATARALVDACHSRGIRVVLDGVFNHCGYNFGPFQDVVAHGADSPYLGWFNIHELPVRARPKPNYETFALDVPDMPKLSTDNPEVRDYLIGAAEHWTRTLDIDGWRLDVADDVDPVLWREFRTRIRAIKPNALIVGEILHDATPFLRGDQMDSVMNYPWRELCLHYFAGRTMGTDAFAERLTTLQMRYRRQVHYALWNLLGSHDRPRFLTLCGGDVRRELLASTFQFTCPGTPYIYYGDEIGIEGDDDPDCRRCMPWNKKDWNTQLLGHYADLARLRRRYSALRRGEFTVLMADRADGPLVYARWNARGAARSCMIVALNNTDRPVPVDLELLAERMRQTDALARCADRPMRTVFSVEGHDGTGSVGATAPGQEPEPQPRPDSKQPERPSGRSTELGPMSARVWVC